MTKFQVLQPTFYRWQFLQSYEKNLLIIYASIELLYDDQEFQIFEFIRLPYENSLRRRKTPPYGHINLKFLHKM